MFRTLESYPVIKQKGLSHQVLSSSDANTGKHFMRNGKIVESQKLHVSGALYFSTLRLVLSGGVPTDMSLRIDSLVTAIIKALPMDHILSQFSAFHVLKTHPPPSTPRSTKWQFPISLSSQVSVMHAAWFAKIIHI
jgi:hypothetical protein